MKMERSASHSLIKAESVVVLPKRVRPVARQRFAPISEVESGMFDMLKAKEAMAEAGGETSSHKARLPRFSLLRGEVAMLAEKVWHISRGAA